MKLIEFKLTLAVPCDVDEETIKEAIKEACIVNMIRNYASTCDIEECGIELARMDKPQTASEPKAQSGTKQANKMR